MNSPDHTNPIRATEDLAVFARKLRSARNRTGLTQHELGRKIRLSQTLISQWENGVRPINLRDISAAEVVLDLPQGALTVPLGYRPITAQIETALELLKLVQSPKFQTPEAQE